MAEQTAQDPSLGRMVSELLMCQEITVQDWQFVGYLQKEQPGSWKRSAVYRLMGLYDKHISSPTREAGKEQK